MTRSSSASTPLKNRAKFSNNYYANNFYNDLNALQKFKDNFFTNQDVQFEQKFQKLLLKDLILDVAQRNPDLGKSQGLFTKVEQKYEEAKDYDKYLKIKKQKPQQIMMASNQGSQNLQQQINTAKSQSSIIMRRIHLKSAQNPQSQRLMVNHESINADSRNSQQHSNNTSKDKHETIESNQQNDMIFSSKDSTQKSKFNDQNKKQNKQNDLNLPGQIIKTPNEQKHHVFQSNYNKLDKQNEGLQHNSKSQFRPNSVSKQVNIQSQMKFHKLDDPSIWDYYVHVGPSLDENFCKNYERKIEASSAAKKIEAKRQRNIQINVNSIEKIHDKLEKLKCKFTNVQIAEIACQEFYFAIE
eukprot:403354190